VTLMSKSPRIVLRAVLSVVALATLAACSSGGASDGASYNPAVTGTLAPQQIEAPPADLATAAGIKPAEVTKAIAAARTLTWRTVKAAGVTQAVACTGSGSPTVVYSNGLLIQAAWTWPLIAQEQAKTNRVCMFDRPGTGLSPDRPTSASPNGPVANAKELFGLMTAINEPGPYLIVGWSYGGIVAQTAAALEPASVAGLNLIDSVTPAQYRTFDKTGWDEAGQPLDMKSAEQAINSAGDFGAKPLVVLVAGNDPEAAGFTTSWTKVQKELAATSTNSAYGVVANVGHTIPQQAPAAVEAAGLVSTKSATSGQPMEKCPTGFKAAGIVC